ncbi:MAG: hypothetical protein COW32_00530 [Candidatus Aquicultor secundus]|nr:MAG: hypothetical protein COW32_00530 [Candidatus Aquicultor secundus]
MVPMRTICAYCLLLTACCLSGFQQYHGPDAHYLCLLPTAYCLLLTAYCLLLTACCLLPLRAHATERRGNNGRLLSRRLGRAGRLS